MRLEAFDKAHALIEERRFEEALALLEGPWEEAEDAAQADRLALLALAGLGRLDQALEAAERVLAYRPSDRDVAAFRVEGLLVKGRLDQARVLAEQSLALDEENDDAWAGLADAAFGLGDEEAGYGALLRGLQCSLLGERVRRAALGRGTARAARIAHSIADAWVQGGLSDALPRFDLACEIGDGAADMAPEERVALYINRSAAYGRFARWFEGAEGLRRAVDAGLEPALRVEAITQIGVAFARALEPVRAELTYHEALEVAQSLGPQLALARTDLHAYLAEALASQGKVEEAQAHLDQAGRELAQATDPEDRALRLLVFRGEVARARGQLQEADRVLSEAFAQLCEQMGLADVWAMRCLLARAQVRRELGEHAQAQKDAQLAVDTLANMGAPAMHADARELLDWIGRDVGL